MEAGCWGGQGSSHRKAGRGQGGRGRRVKRAKVLPTKVPRRDSCPFGWKSVPKDTGSNWGGGDLQGASGSH